MSKPNCHTLYRCHRYRESLAAARVAMPREADSFQIGAVLTVGQCLILLGRYAEAQRHLEPLAKARHALNARMGDHFAYLGLAQWFDRDHEHAVKTWEAGLKAQYQSLEGMELPWILLYAAARDPGCLARDRAELIVREKAKRLGSVSDIFRLNEFLLRRKTYDEVIAELHESNAGRYHDQLMIVDRSLVDFLAGVHALFDGDIERFYEQMLACASITGHQSDTAVQVIAECELRHGPLKWKRRFSAWLRQNVTNKPSKSSRSRKKSKTSR